MNFMDTHFRSIDPLAGIDEEPAAEKKVPLNYKKPETLNDTVLFMNSGDYRMRFVAEYWQTKIRWEKLKKFNTKIEAEQWTGEEQTKHDCPLALLKDQQKFMGEYLHILEVRAELEGIEL